jgi:hypothetical protein
LNPLKHTFTNLKMNINTFMKSSKKGIEIRRASLLIVKNKAQNMQYPNFPASTEHYTLAADLSFNNQSTFC